MDCSTSGFSLLHHLPSLLKLMSIESVMSSNHLTLCRTLLLLPSIFPSIRVFSNESIDLVHQYLCNDTYFYFYWGIADIILALYISFMCSMYWLHIFIDYILYKVAIILVTIFLIPCKTGSSYDNPLDLFCIPSPLPLFWQPLVCSLLLLVCFCLILLVNLFYFLDSKYKWKQIVSVFLCLNYSTLHNLFPAEPSMMLQVERFPSFFNS